MHFGPTTFLWTCCFDKKEKKKTSQHARFFIPHYIITRLHYVWCQMNSAVMLLQLAEAGTPQHMVKLHNISHFGACSSPVSGWQSALVNKISSEKTYWLAYRRQCSFWTASEAGTGFEWKHKHMYTHKHTPLSAHNALEWNMPSLCFVNINSDRNTIVLVFLLLCCSQSCSVQDSCELFTKVTCLQDFVVQPVFPASFFPPGAACPSPHFSA